MGLEIPDLLWGFQITRVPNSINSVFPKISLFCLKWFLSVFSAVPHFIVISLEHVGSVGVSMS